MSARKRRSPIGTEADAAPRGASKRRRTSVNEAAGTIETPVVQGPEHVDHEGSVIVQSEDDWLARLDLPID